MYIFVIVNIIGIFRQLNTFLIQNKGVFKFQMVDSPPVTNAVRKSMILFNFGEINIEYLATFYTGYSKLDG